MRLSLSSGIGRESDRPSALHAATAESRMALFRRSSMELC